MSLIEVFAVLMSRYTSKDYMTANGAYVGLAAPGDVGSWQRECKVIFLTFFFFCCKISKFYSKVKITPYSIWGIYCWCISEHENYNYPRNPTDKQLDD